MLKKLRKLNGYIGNTPTLRLGLESIEAYAKLEYTNFSGSIKDRAAYNILYEGMINGEITENTTIIESSSGNFAIALATICNFLNLKFVAVIDPNINLLYEKRIRLLAHDVLKVNEVDETGGYLLSRIQRVKQYCQEKNDIFWPNQYENPNNYLAYYRSLGEEICAHFDSLDYLFVAVSSCGTITGLSKRLKESFPTVEVIAVDIEGSVIFRNIPAKRHLSGIGASKRPSILNMALIDDIIHVTEEDIAIAANDMLKEQSLFVGASTAASYWAIKKYFMNKIKANPKVLFLCHDSGYAYMETIYNQEWIKYIQSRKRENVSV